MNKARPMTDPQVDTNGKRIAAVLGQHYYKDWAVDGTERCSCGNIKPGKSWPEHVADVLIAAGVTMIDAKAERKSGIRLDGGV